MCLRGNTLRLFAFSIMLQLSHLKQTKTSKYSLICASRSKFYFVRLQIINIKYIILQQA